MEYMFLWGGNMMSGMEKLEVKFYFPHRRTVVYKEPPEKRQENHRLLVTAPFAFCVITFEPIEVQTRSAHQNDC